MRALGGGDRPDLDPETGGKELERQQCASQGLGFRGQITTLVLPLGGPLAMAGGIPGCLGTGVPLASNGQRQGGCPAPCSVRGGPHPKTIPSRVLVVPGPGTLSGG